MCVWVFFRAVVDCRSSFKLELCSRLRMSYICPMLPIPRSLFYILQWSCIAYMLKDAKEDEPEEDVEEEGEEEEPREVDEVLEDEEDDDAASLASGVSARSGASHVSMLSRGRGGAAVKAPSLALGSVGAAAASVKKPTKKAAKKKKGEEAGEDTEAVTETPSASETAALQAAIKADAVLKTIHNALDTDEVTNCFTGLLPELHIETREKYGHQIRGAGKG